MTEDDISNDLDWNADGIVNFKEFAPFAAAWLSHDPNEPGGDPNFAVGWNPTCNFDDTGDSQYTIDLADFALFCDEWLWAACWKLEQINEAMAMFGGESMMMPMMESTTFESTVTESAEEVNPYAEMPESELVLFVKSIYEVIDSIEKVIDEDHENTENLLDAKEFLEDVLSDIRESRQ